MLENKKVKKLYFHKLAERIAKTAVNSSSMRKQGPKGTISLIRKYLIEKINLDEIPRSSSKKYLQFINKHTVNIQRNCFKHKHLFWGSARKALNIYLRDSVYCYELCHRYNLIKIKKYMEIPVDKNVFEALKYIVGIEKFKWNSIKRLGKENHSYIQQIAYFLANKLKKYRVDLDVFFWVKDKNDFSLNLVKKEFNAVLSKKGISI